MFQVTSHQDSEVFTKVNDQQHINHNNSMSCMLQNFTQNSGF